MSNYDYYRGSSSYEDAVKKRLNALAVTGAATTHAVRSMESGMTFKRIRMLFKK